MISPANVSLVALSSKTMDKLHARPDCHAEPGDTPVIGSRTDDVLQQNICVAGNCDRFNLANDEDRAKYAELSANLLAGSEYVRIWEERVPGANGDMIVYVNYMRYANVNQTARRSINLKD